MEKIRSLLQNFHSENIDAVQATDVLYTACTCGNPQVTSLIAENHSHFEFCEQHLLTKSFPLLEAARKHDVAFFDTLAQNPDFKEKYTNCFSMVDSEGNTLLHIAANNEDVGIVKFALEFGLDPQKGNYKGVTPLHFTAMRGSEGIAKLLLDWEKEKETDVRAYIAAKAVGVCNETPFYFAAKFNHPSMIKFLLQRSDITLGNYYYCFNALLMQVF